MPHPKKCSRCKKAKPLSEFNFKNKEKGLLQKSCKQCTRQEIRNHYYKNRDYYLAKVKKRNLSIQQTSHEFIQKYLSSHSCMDCGEKDPIVLDFDHQKDKIDSISNLVKNKYSLATIKKEIKKCEVRCANCHRRKTAKDFNWYRFNGKLKS